jgi:hypothetical protein
MGDAMSMISLDCRIQLQYMSANNYRHLDCQSGFNHMIKSFMSPRHPGWRRMLVISVLASAFVSVGHAQVFDLSAGPPVVTLGSGRPAALNSRPAALTDSKGRQVAITYDASGRPAAFKVGPKLNIADMRVVYEQSGRIGAVRFANDYAIRFEYRADGTQVVSDVLGNSIERKQSSAGAFAAHVVSDRQSYLQEALRRVEALIGSVQQVAGLATITNAP